MGNIIGHRQTEVITLHKGDIRTLYQPLTIESLQSEDGFDMYVNGQDFRLTPEGHLEWLGDEARLGQKATLIYNR